MFAIFLLIDLFISLIEQKNIEKISYKGTHIPLLSLIELNTSNKYTCKFKIDKKNPTQCCCLEQHMMVAKIKL